MLTKSSAFILILVFVCNYANGEVNEATSTTLDRYHSFSVQDNALPMELPVGIKIKKLHCDNFNNGSRLTGYVINTSSKTIKFTLRVKQYDNDKDPISQWNEKKIALEAESGDKFSFAVRHCDVYYKLSSIYFDFT